MKSFDVFVYATLEQESPSWTFNIKGGSFLDSMRVVSDPDQGTIIECFEYRTINELMFSVVSEDQERTNELTAIFLTASKLRASEQKESDQSIKQDESVL